MALDRRKWPQCLLWRGWLPGLSLAGERDLWAASLGNLAARAVEQCLGAYHADDSGFWTPPVFWDADDLAMGLGITPLFGLTVTGRIIL